MTLFLRRTFIEEAKICLPYDASNSIRLGGFLKSFIYHDEITSNFSSDQELTLK
jgi:hypothetical protein